MRIHNLCFHGEIGKTIFGYSSYLDPISSNVIFIL